MNYFYFVLLSIITLSTLYPNSVYGQSGKGEICKIAGDSIEQASKIRQLKSKHSVPCLVHGREDIRSYLFSIIEKQLPDEKLRNEELVYKILGFFPDTFDYKKGVVELYLSQIGGYYDPERDRFVMAGWLPDSMQTGIAVHELTHALQDQYFNLEKIVDLTLNNSDAILARSALIEGDASAVMFDYERSLIKEKPLKEVENIDGLLMANLVSIAGASSDGIPKSLQMILIFPYTGGLRFAHAILKKGGYSELSKAYQNLPRSTEEILHPEVYMTELGNPKIISDQALIESEIPVEFSMLYSDTLGEFGISALLTMLDLPANKVSQSSVGWGGDRLALFSDLDNKRKILVWHSLWDTAQDAVQFCEALREGYSKKFPKLKSQELGEWARSRENSQAKLECSELSVRLRVELGETR